MTEKSNILIIDDNLKNIQVGINFLKQNPSYHLIFATSGQQALERVKETEFDLILLDIIMPVMDGYEVCRKLKDDRETREIPVLFLTAKQEAEDIVKGFECGGADYITKPFNSHELMARVRTHLDLRRNHKTEIQRLEKLLAQSQRVETLSFLIQGIVHDINNFLNSIAPNIHKIKKKITNKIFQLEEYDNEFEGIVSAMRKTSELLRHMSELGRKHEQSEVVDMNIVVSELNKIFKSSLKSDISLDIKFLDSPAYAFAQKIHIEQVLVNLIINAQKAIIERQKNDDAKGMISLIISKTAINSEDDGKNISYLKIEVKDNGIGILQENFSKVFTPYYTTRKDEGGTGLGLAVSQKIVKSHGGEITVSSEYGSGSCFTILFPFYSN